MSTDFELTNHGTLFVLDPVTDDAKAWAGEHLPEDAMTWGDGVVIEPRYIGPILDGIKDDGLTVG